MTPWKFPTRHPTRQRLEALDGKVGALQGRLEEMAARFDRLSGDLDRLFSELGEVQRRLDAESAGRRDQAGQLSVVRDAVAQQQADSRTASDALGDLRIDSQRASDAVADLRAENRATSDVIARQASLLEERRDEGERQERSLDQIRADFMRMERQSAADLTELRATDAALARMVLKVNSAVWQTTPRPPKTSASPGRLDEAADELTPPEGSPLPIVEEEPSERQTPQ